MKNIIQILSLILIFSCNNNKSSESNIESTRNSEEIEEKKLIEIKFTPDSSYVQYWCSTEILKKTAESLDKLNLTDVADFLATFHGDCKKNTMYAEWSNELLFEVANKKPDFILQLLLKNSSLDKELIKSEFESPIHDGIDLDKIIIEIEKANSPIKIKKEIVESLKKGKSKY